jgi:hypothetical protein
MFLVSDTQANPHAKIRGYLDTEPAIAVLLSAADFEWTVRRAILKLSHAPTREIRAELLNCHGAEAYQRAWAKFVTPHRAKRLTEVVPDWVNFRDHGMKLRHRIIHGTVGSVGGDYVRIRVGYIMDASVAVAQFAEQHGKSVYSRLVARR